MTAQVIQLVDIPKELERLQEEQLGQNRIRACLFNMVIYAVKGEQEKATNDLIKSVIGKFPCRIILISSSESQQAFLKTHVRSEAIGEGNDQAFCEIITIEVSGDLKERVPFIILPELLPDLPIYLLWTIDPSKENLILPYLMPLAHKIIFDSKAATDIRKFSGAVLGLMNTCDKDVADLTWTALSGWRNLIATSFSSVYPVSSIDKSRLIKISYNHSSQPLSSLQALYLAAWIAARLKWTFNSEFTEKGARCLRFSSSSQSVEIHLVPEEIKSLQSGCITKIEIDSELAKGHYIFKRNPTNRQVQIQFSDAERCDIPYSYLLPSIQPGGEIIEELFSEKSNEHYKSMLSVLSQLPNEPTP